MTGVLFAGWCRSHARIAGLEAEKALLSSQLSDLQSRMDVVVAANATLRHSIDAVGGHAGYAGPSSAPSSTATTVTGVASASASAADGGVGSSGSSSTAASAAGGGDAGGAAGSAAPGGVAGVGGRPRQVDEGRGGAPPRSTVAMGLYRELARTGF